LPDGAELKTVAKYMTVSPSSDGKRLVSVSLVVHPYMTAAEVTSLQSALVTKLAGNSHNPSAVMKKGEEVEVWLRELRGSTEMTIPKRSENYLCIDRDRYRFCARYRHSTFGQGFTVTYEATATTN
jgi:hypothetical protein